MAKYLSKNIFGYLASVCSIVSVFIFWFVITELKLISPIFLPSPRLVLQTVLELEKTGELTQDISISLIRIFQGYILGVIIGISIGVGMGQSKRLRDYLEPLVNIVRSIPPAAWIPLSILWFGIAEPSKIFLIMLGSLWPTLIATFDGVRLVDPNLIRAALCLGCKPWKTFYKIRLPAAIPQIFTGLYLSLSAAIRVVIVAELAGATVGIGYLTMLGGTVGRIDITIVGGVVIGLLGLISTRILELVRRRVLRWHKATVL